jgi:hypothetical protein
MESPSSLNSHAFFQSSLLASLTWLCCAVMRAFFPHVILGRVLFSDLAQFGDIQKINRQAIFML